MEGSKTFGGAGDGCFKRKGLLTGMEKMTTEVISNLVELIFAKLSKWKPMVQCRDGTIYKKD